MNGPHDMGGMQCFGPVVPELNEPVFHADWEKRALAITVASGFCGQWNIDVSRHIRESLPPDFYLSRSYYEIWIAGLTKLLLDREMITSQELENGNAKQPPIPVKKVVCAQDMPAALLAGAPVERPGTDKPAFAVGQSVRTRNLQPAGHTRLPGYARDKSGRIERIHGRHVFPDSNAAGEGENPQWLYSVAFDRSTLFGDGAAQGEVMVDCWEPYLEAGDSDEAGND